MGNGFGFQEWCHHIQTMLVSNVAKIRIDYAIVNEGSCRDTHMAGPECTQVSNGEILQECQAGHSQFRGRNASWILLDTRLG